VEFQRESECRPFPGIEVRGDCLQGVGPGIANFQPPRAIGEKIANQDWCSWSREFLEHSGWYRDPTKDSRQEILLSEDDEIAQRAAVRNDNHED